jgi:hypothetical protein
LLPAKAVTKGALAEPGGEKKRDLPRQYIDYIHMHAFISFHNGHSVHAGADGAVAGAVEAGD